MAPAPDQEDSSMSDWRRARPAIAAAVIALLLLLGWLTYRWYNRVDARVEAARSARPGPVVEITAPQLAAAYDRDPIRANTLYDGRILKVTGVVTEIGAGAAGPLVILGGAGPLLTVNAAFDKADVGRVATIQPGTRVTVTCRRVSLVAQSPGLDDCTIG